MADTHSALKECRRFIRGQKQIDVSGILASTLAFLINLQDEKNSDQSTLTDTPLLPVAERLSDVTWLTLTHIEVTITFGVFITPLALDVQLAKLIVPGLCKKIGKGLT